MAGDLYRVGHPYARAIVELGSIRAVLAVPLLKDGVAVGMIAIYRQKPDAFLMTPRIFQIGPKTSAKSGCSCSMPEKRCISGRSLASGIMGIRS